MKDYLKFYAIANPAVELVKHALMDAFEKGYELGYEDGGNDRCSERCGNDYDKGLDDAWECAKKIAFCNQGELCKIFPEDDFDDNDLGWLDKYTASEAMTKVKEYEGKQPEMTRDEARAIIDIVFKCKRRIIDTHYCEGTSCTGCEFHIPAEKIEKAREVLKN